MNWQYVYTSLYIHEYVYYIRYIIDTIDTPAFTQEN